MEGRWLKLVAVVVIGVGAVFAYKHWQGCCKAPAQVQGWSPSFDSAADE